MWVTLKCDASTDHPHIKMIGEHVKGSNIYLEKTKIRVPNLCNDELNETQQKHQWPIQGILPKTY